MDGIPKLPLLCGVESCAYLFVSERRIWDLTNHNRSAIISREVDASVKAAGEQDSVFRTNIGVDSSLTRSAISVRDDSIFAREMFGKVTGEVIGDCMDENLIGVMLLSDLFDRLYQFRVSNGFLLVSDISDRGDEDWPGCAGEGRRGLD